ncbi:hypothetical protein EYC84_007225 [Monilinia fructicola]|uniref:Uncharacterized protein n=1 Tax=Monilinia fructicola TaxID=38448 RepID=A0A5M9KAX0_MONFR|nr:hypothetical protein EYC84_007225 [Monilinia fructicola]
MPVTGYEGYVWYAIVFLFFCCFAILPLIPSSSVIAIITPCVSPNNYRTPSTISLNRISYGIMLHLALLARPHFTWGSSGFAAGVSTISTPTTIHIHTSTIVNFHPNHHPIIMYP